MTKEQKVHPTVKEESKLVELLFKKYENHFAKLRLMNTMNPEGENRVKREENHLKREENRVKREERVQTQTTIAEKEQMAKEVFHVLRSREGCKIEDGEFPSMRSIEGQMEGVNRFGGERTGFVDMVLEAREKEVRADLFLSADPFEELKRFFRSKDSDPYDF